MLFEGYKFGMMLQFAIGPICLFIFNISSNYNVVFGLTGVLGVTIVDAFFILLAIYGVAELIKKEEVKKLLKYGGALILIFFGIKFIYGGLCLNYSTLMVTGYQISKVFIESVIFTASNPLTIIFWGGIFSSKLAEGNIIKKDAYLFGIGSVLSTLTFLMVVVIAGTITKAFLPFFLIKLLNIAVGLALIGFGIKYIIFNKNFF